MIRLRRNAAIAADGDGASYADASGGSHEDAPSESMTEDEMKQLGFESATSTTTILQLLICAATAIAEPVLGSIDTYWVAWLGTTALAALGPNTCIFSSVIAVVAMHGIGTATTRSVAIALERDVIDKKRGGKGGFAGSTMVNVMSVTTAFGLACTAFLLLFSSRVVNFIGCSPEIVGIAAEYMRWRAIGVPAVIIIDVIAGACQSARDAKTPAAGILLAGVLNLIIDPVLIFTVGMGFNGAALATVIAQYASAIMLTWFTFKGRGMKNFFEEGVGVTTPFPSFDAGVAWAYAKEVFSVLGRVLNLVAVWFYTGAVASGLGVSEGAAHVLIFQICCVLSICSGALCTVANTLTARLSVSHGDGAAREAGNVIASFGVVTSTIFSAFFYLLRVQILGAFTSDVAVVDAALAAYPILMASVMMYWYKALEGALIGRGDAGAVNWIFLGGAAACWGSLKYAIANGALSLKAVWMSIFYYYLVIVGSMCVRWVWLNKIRDPREKNADDGEPIPAH